MSTLYSSESRLCRDKAKLEKSGPASLSPEEKENLLANCVLIERPISGDENIVAGVVALYKAGLEGVLERYFEALDKNARSTEKYKPHYWPDDLIKYLLTEPNPPSKWITRGYRYLMETYSTFGQYGHLPESTLAYLDDEECRNHLRAAIVNYKPPATAKWNPYVHEILSPENYAKKLAEYAERKNWHGSWVLAHDHGKIEEAIHYTRLGNCYLSLQSFATGGGCYGPKYDYSKYFTE